MLFTNMKMLLFSESITLGLRNDDKCCFFMFKVHIGLKSKVNAIFQIIS